MFTDLKALKIPQGDVVKIECNGNLIWEEPASFKNWVEYSINTDGSIFNGVGYQKGCRISSSGAIKTATYAGVTGFIPLKAGDTVYFKDAGINLMWAESGEYTSGNAIGYYNSSFAYLGVYTRQPAYYGICNSSNMNVTGSTDAGGICSFVVPNNANIAYMRLGVCTNHSDGTGIEDLIITVNEEITD